jgi:hypothetical protein
LEHRTSNDSFHFNFLIYESVGLFGRGISPPQGRFLTQTQNTHTTHALSWIRTHDPSVRTYEDISCLRAATLIRNVVYYYLFAYLFNNVVRPYSIVGCDDQSIMHWQGCGRKWSLDSRYHPSICLYCGKPSQAIRYSSRGLGTSSPVIHDFKRTICHCRWMCSNCLDFPQSPMCVIRLACQQNTKASVFLSEPITCA